MPGIAGIIGTPGNREIILRMTEQMKHEKFYSMDTYADENVALGITSLIPDNKITFNTTKTLIALMDGEVFGLTKQRAETNTETLLHLYEKEGTKFLAELNGWFNLIIYDCGGEHTGSPLLYLITDRYGFKPLYYTEIGGKFIFASEIKSILVYPEFNKDIDPVGVAEFALFNYPLGERTFVKNIQRMPPASIWQFNAGAIHELPLQKRNYWEFSTLLKGELLSHRESVEQCGEAFWKVVNSLIKEDRGIGLTLTAGYDTRAILSALNDVEVKCLTFGSRNDIQAVVGSKLAQVAQCEHYVQEFGTDFVEQVNDFLYRTVWIAEGMSNIVHSGWFYVFNKVCRDELSEANTRVRPYFLGLGGSELIRGLQNTSLAFSCNSQNILMSKAPAQTWLNIMKQDDSYGFFSYDFLKDFVPNSQLSILNSQFSLNERALLFTLLEIFRKYYWANVSLIGSQVRVRLPYMAHNFISFVLHTPYSILHTRQFSHNPFERLRGQQFSASIIKYNNPNLLIPPTDRGYSPGCNLHWYGYPTIFWHQIHRRIFGAPIPELSIVKVAAKEIINEIVCASPVSHGNGASRDYYNLPKLKSAINSYPDWSGHHHWSLLEWEELSKVVTFELWVRQFMK